GPDGTRRPFVVVVCRDDADLHTTVAHLVDDIGVSVILAALPARNFSRAVEARDAQETVLFIGPEAADSNVIRADQAGLAWHLLGSAADLVPAYLALLERTEAYLRSDVEPVAGEAAAPAVRPLADGEPM